MANEEINRDKQLRKKLENFSVPPPPLVWDNIKGQIKARQRKRRIVYASWISAAAVVVLAFIAGWYFNNNEIGHQQTTEQRISETETKQDVLIAEHDKTIVTSDSTLYNNKNEVLQNETGTSEEELLVASGKKAEKKTPAEAVIETLQRVDLKRLRPAEPKIKAKEQKTGLANKIESVSETLFSDLDKNLIASNARIQKSKEDLEKGWKMGMHVSPGYSSNVSSHSESYSRNMTYSSEDGNTNIGAGLSIQYKTSKKLSVESGIYYAQGGQSSRNSFELLPLSSKSRPDTDLSYDYAGPASEAFSNAISINNGNIAMNSKAGVIEMTSTPEGVEIENDFESFAGGLSNRLVSNGEFSQVFDFVEIPLYLRYSIIDSKWGLELMGGLNTGIVVGNNAYIENSYGLQNIGKTQDISTINFSGTLGVGINYAVGKHVSVSVEPRLNYYLNSINTSSEVNFRPYRIGVYTGLYYEF